MILTINQGKIMGNSKRSAWSSKIFYSFLGIPFAEPPIGDLRFKSPVKAGNWKGVFTAFKEGKECYQTTFKKPNVEGSEDCLYLNVFIPEKPNPKKLKPVMVNVHGGGFSSFSGSPKTSSPDHLMETDVILVTFNYRLHVLGFLNLGLSDCLGNMGLKDQLLAFQWVKENIECFGGDPDNITLFGQSAGASSIHLHMMSSLSDGLFHKCILQSGSAQSEWSFCECPEERAFELASILGYRGNDKGELLKFLKKVSVGRLSTANDELRNQLRKRYPGKCSAYPFVPSVEKIKQGALLPRPPNELLKNTRKIPTIIGMNEREGGNMFIKEPAIMQILQNNFEYVMKINTNIDGIERHLEEVKHFYFKNGIISGKEELSDLYTDLYFKHFYKLEDLQLENPKTPLYTYEFCYDGSVNFFKYFSPHLVGDIKGAIHADDHFYIFGANWFFKNPLFKFTPNDINVTKFMCRMWSNFAKTGNPNGDNVPITWRPTTKQQRCYLKIDKTLELKYGRIHERRYQFWENLKLKLEKTVTPVSG